MDTVLLQTPEKIVMNNRIKCPFEIDVKNKTFPLLINTFFNQTLKSEQIISLRVPRPKSRFGFVYFIVNI